MRPVFALAAALSGLGLVAAAPPDPRPAAAPRPAAVESAQGHQSPAAYVSRPQQGYSAETRHAADCLASFPGYDVKTDRMPASGGATRRCPL